MPEHARTYCSQKILNMFNMFCHIWHLIEHLFNWHQAIKHSWKILRLVHRCSHKPPFHRIFPITPLSSQMFPYICQYLSCVPILNPTLSRIFHDFSGFSMIFHDFPQFSMAISGDFTRPPRPRPVGPGHGAILPGRTAFRVDIGHRQAGGLSVAPWRKKGTADVVVYSS